MGLMLLSANNGLLDDKFNKSFRVLEGYIFH